VWSGKSPDQILIAAVIPLVISGFAGEGGGTTLGLFNSGRFVGNALVPMMDTTLMAQFGLLPLYLTIAGLTIAMLVTFLSSIKINQVGTALLKI
jgi:hypothetical protein